MGKYDQYVEACENEGTTPDGYGEWAEKQRALGRARKAAAMAMAEPEDGGFDDPKVETPPIVNPVEADPEDLAATVARLEARLAALEPKTEIPHIPEKPRVWGEDGSYSYMSDTLELEITIEAGTTYIRNGRFVTIPDKSVKFSGGTFSTRDPEVRDFLEQTHEFLGDEGAKYPARVWRTDILTPGHHVVKVVDGPKSSRSNTQERYADRPSPLHANA